MEWVYRATRNKVDAISTMILADKRGFLCRSARSSAGVWAANVKNVAIGDVIHFYYMQAGKKPRELGAYEVVASEAHVRPQQFGAQIEGSALYEVAPGELNDYLEELRGYVPDPITDGYVGWAIKRVGRAPTFDAKLFTGMNTLQQYDGPPDDEDEDVATN